MSSFLKSIILVSVLAFSVFSVAHAQSIPGISEPITLNIVPEYPQPNTITTITAKSFSTDLNRATFNWKVNGKTVSQGVGVTQIVISSGNPGTKTNVSVSIDTIDIGSVIKDISIRPSDVTLLWQSDGYVPPFYKGKALLLYGSTFKVTAIPEFFDNNGKRIDPKTVIYTWKKNGNVDSSQSGYGKNSFISTQASYVRSGDDISVEASTVSHDMLATNNVTISPANSDIVFYEDSPLYGIIYEKALENILTLSSEEITLKAEPFNVSGGILTYDWTMNGAAVQEFKNKNEITLRKVGNISGQTNVGLQIQHMQKILQGGSTGITIFQ